MNINPPGLGSVSESKSPTSGRQSNYSHRRVMYNVCGLVILQIRMPTTTIIDYLLCTKSFIIYNLPCIPVDHNFL